MRWIVCVVPGLVALSGCPQDSGQKFVLGEKIQPCSLSLDQLADTMWLMERINPDRSTTPDVQTRLSFHEVGGALHARYNVGSLSDMYDYDCKKRGEELYCWEPPKLQDWCQALLAGGQTCDPEQLRKWAGPAQVTDQELGTAIQKANEAADHYRNTPQWDAFVRNNHNLANKLQGILYVAIDKRHCQLRITDDYMTIYDGKRIEDSNPVGTNLFSRTEDELLWEHCDDAEHLLAMKEADYPSRPERARTCAPNLGCNFAVGETVHYHLVPEKPEKPQEGCTYSYDQWLDWRPLRKGAAPAQVRGRRGMELHWSFDHIYQDPGVHVMEIVRSRTCDGKQERIGVSCNLVRVNQ